MKRRCKECLFTSNRVVDKKRMENILALCKKKETWFECHLSTIAGEHVCCRGFFDGPGQDIAIIQVAQRFKAVEEVEEERYDR